MKAGSFFFVALLLLGGNTATAQLLNRTDQVEATRFYKAGSALLKEKKYKEAILEFNNALSINRANADYHYAKGLAHYNLEKYHSATNDLQRAVALDSTQANYYYYLGLIHREFGELGKSNEFFWLALKMNKNSYLKINQSNVRSHIGINYLKQEKYKSAVEIFDVLIANNPENMNAFVNRGIASGYLNDYSHACSDFVKASQLGHSNAAGYMKKYCGN